jgi:uncharacterized protein
MSYSTRFVFHIYGDGGCAVEMAERPHTDTVFTEILFFCLMVSRTLLKIKQRREVLDKAARWLDSFRMLWLSILGRTIDSEGIGAEIKRIAVGREFRGSPGKDKIIATLTIPQPQSADYRFDVTEKGWFGLLGGDAPGAYGLAMVCLWSVLVQSRITDLIYIRSLNAAGFLIGKSFFDGKLSLRTEPNVIRDVLRTLKESQGTITPTSTSAKVFRSLQETNPDFSTGLLLNISGLIDKANGGDADSQALLGLLYEEGNAVLQDMQESANWYRKAAHNGNAVSQVYLGDVHRGRGEYEDAVKWYRKAADQGYPGALIPLAQMYGEGRGVTRDAVKAVELYRKGAEKGDMWCQTFLAYAYMQGEGVDKDESLAFKWYKSAAQQGLDSAQGTLGSFYYWGTGVEQDYAQALEWFRKAAEQGNAQAQSQIGVMYRNGEGLGQDFRAAAEWWRKAAAQGEPYGQLNLGDLYKEGKGVPTDISEAIRLYHEAAKQGLPAAIVRLAMLYDSLGNISEARKWYLSAAELGIQGAKERLAELL